MSAALAGLLLGLAACSKEPPPELLRERTDETGRRLLSEVCGPDAARLVGFLAIRPELVPGKPDPGRLFLTKSGRKMDGSSVPQTVRKAAILAGIERKYHPRKQGEKDDPEESAGAVWARQ